MSKGPKGVEAFSWRGPVLRVQRAPVRWARKGFGGYGAGSRLPVELVEAADADDAVQEVLRARLGGVGREVVVFRSTDDPRAWSAVRLGRHRDQLVVAAVALAEPLERVDGLVFDYVAGRAALPRAVAAVLAALGTLDIGGDRHGTVEACLARGGGGRFLSPQPGDRVAAAREGSRWPFAQWVAAHDGDPAVRAALAEGARLLRPETVVILAADPDRRVRRVLARGAADLSSTARASLLADTVEVRTELVNFAALHLLAAGELRRLLEDPDPEIVLRVLRAAGGGNDYSPAAWHRDRRVRLTAATTRWGLLDEAARAHLRSDPDPEIAAAASPALGCRAYRSVADSAAHDRMADPTVPAAERLDAARSTIGARGGHHQEPPESAHTSCVISAVCDVVAALDDDAGDLVEQAATVALGAVATACSRYVPRVGLASLRHWVTDLAAAGTHLHGSARDTWDRILEPISIVIEEWNPDTPSDWRDGERHHKDRSFAESSLSVPWVRLGLYPSTRNTPRPPSPPTPKHPPGFHPDRLHHHSPTTSPPAPFTS